MPNELDSNARCLKAIQLTFRFVLTCFVPLALLLVSVCFVFGSGYKPGVSTGMAILVLYFTVAYHNIGRNNRVALVVAGLAGLNARRAASGTCDNKGTGEADPAFNPATGLIMMGGCDSMGNPYGIDLNSGGMSGDEASMFENNHLSFNPANGLPMMDDMTDVHGNIFGTNSMDDITDHGSAFDNSITHTSFDGSFNNSTFDDSFNSGTVDDDWNK